MIAVPYVAAWAAGLAIGAPELSPADDGEGVLTAYREAPLALLQAILVHGVAGVLLACLAIAHATRGAASGTWRAPLIVAAGVTAAFLSFGQLAGEIILSVAPPTPVDAVAVWDAVAIVDGAKMAVLAVLVLGCLTARSGRWVVVVAVVTSVSLLVSGVGYLMLHLDLMAAAYVSLPLLLVWSIWAAVPRRSRAAAAGSGPTPVGNARDSSPAPGTVGE